LQLLEEPFLLPLFAGVMQAMVVRPMLPIRVTVWVSVWVRLLLLLLLLLMLLLAMAAAACCLAAIVAAAAAAVDVDVDVVLVVGFLGRIGVDDLLLVVLASFVGDFLD